ncbi:MAG: hypothetical protein L6R37_001083 [Teloschistes peruensis]|nr:MAG: hypothetical protein L6R37_001083 [Teloschistes peruensis]
MASPSSAAHEEQSDQDQDDRYDLRHWHPAWDAQNNHFDRPGRFALHGETLFALFCEAIVRYIEDSTLNDADEWLNVRVRYRDIIALGTFGRFAEVMQEGVADADQQVLRLRRMVLVRPQALLTVDYYGALDGLMEMMAPSGQYQRIWGGGFVSADEQTYGRLSRWFTRITASRDALYRRLYGVRRRSIKEQ